jgi:group I intron endonuclease
LRFEYIYDEFRREAVSGLIYKIVNKVNDKFYVGSTTRTMKKRMADHIRIARQGKHHSIIFQNAWNKYGEKSFTMHLLEECDEANVVEREQYYLDTLEPKYNIMKVAGRPPVNREASRQLALRLHREGIWSNDRPIIQYDLETGEEVGSYETAKEIADRDGFDRSAISMCCTGIRGSHGGFGWRFADGSTPEWKYEELGSPVVSYDPLTGKDVKGYKSIVEAVEDGFVSSNIGQCCLGNRNTHRDLGWRYADCEPRIIDRLREIRPVESFNLGTGVAVKVYENAYRAQKDGFNPSLIRLCLYGTRHSHKGLGWRYVGEEAKSKKRTLKKVIRIDMQTGEEKVYDSASSVKHDGFSPQKVGACCLGRRKTHKGFKWDYEANI